jgi:hypothetical protein
MGDHTGTVDRKLSHFVDGPSYFERADGLEALGLDQKRAISDVSSQNRCANHVVGNSVYGVSDVVNGE